ncbi:MAG TPA: hypothetical protein VGB82_25900 [Alphaproteobacteria bacterium]
MVLVIRVARPDRGAGGNELNITPPVVDDIAGLGNKMLAGAVNPTPPAENRLQIGRIVWASGLRID